MNDNITALLLVSFIAFLVVSLIFTSEQNKTREHEQYIMCIEKNMQWVSGSCIYKYQKD